LIGRFPIGHGGLAPYVFGGGGYQFDVIEQWLGNVGAGLEYRFTRNWGVFIDARYVFTDETKNYGLGRLGVRFSF
jgi:outer membrane protein W